MLFELETNDIRKKEISICFEWKSLKKNANECDFTIVLLKSHEAWKMWEKEMLEVKYEEISNGNQN